VIERGVDYRRAVARIHRNDPCPCGSRRKYKKCHGAGPDQRLCTAEERNDALCRVLDLIDPQTHRAARARFFGRHIEQVPTFDPQLFDMAQVVFEFWLCFDEPEEGNETAADFLLARGGVPENERRYLESVRKSSFRLYEVVDVTPDVGLSLRDLLDGREVTVRERSGSRSLHAWDVIGARVVEPGASGFTEIDGGILPIAKPRKDAVLETLRALHAELPPLEFRQQSVIFLVDAWLTRAPMPRMKNYDGHDLLMTKVHFDVVDRAALVAALDHHPDVVPKGDGLGWGWVGTGTDRKEPISRGFIVLDGARLTVEVNSKERGEAAVAWMTTLVGTASVYRVTEHEDLEKAMERVRADGTGAPPLPPELDEPAREAARQVMQDHYERWVDEPVPMFDGRTPRDAARDPDMRQRVAASIEELEGMYERALLANDHGLFDPTWLWDELGIADLARGRSRRRPVPRLAHEVIADLDPDVADAAADIGDRARRTQTTPMRGRSGRATWKQTLLSTSSSVTRTSTPSRTASRTAERRTERTSGRGSPRGSRCSRAGSCTSARRSGWRTRSRGCLVRRRSTSPATASARRSRALPWCSSIGTRCRWPNACSPPIRGHASGAASCPR